MSNICTCSLCKWQHTHDLRVIGLNRDMDWGIRAIGFIKTIKFKNETVRPQPYLKD